MIYYQNGKLLIRSMERQDTEALHRGFEEQGLHKSPTLFAFYFGQQEDGTRKVLVAVADGAAAGYVTLVPAAEDGPFVGSGIPEIKDFNVLPSFRGRGIGGRLMDAVEALAGETHHAVCLGVGLYGDYGSAQRMYAKRGYVPDGSGIWYGNDRVEPGRDVFVDDDLILYMSKKLTTDGNG